VAACGGNFKSALGGLLAANIFEIDSEVLQLAEHFGYGDADRLALNCADHT
jgi:hypothetical protein